MDKSQVIDSIRSQPEQTLADIELLRTELIAANVMVSQLTKQLRLMENVYRVKIQGLESEVEAQNAKAIEFWSVVIEIRKLASESLFVTK